MAIKNGEIVEKYLKAWSKLPTMTLARKIYNENKGAFPNLEAVRTAVRFRRGTTGKVNRQSAADKTHFTEKAVEKLTLEDIDEGIDEREPDFVFAKSIERMLVISDLHVPYHNAEGIKIALRYGKEKKIDALLINGDFMDFAPISHFTKDPYTKMNLSSDLDLGRKMLRIFRNTFPNVPIYFKLGNHCFIKGTEVLTDNGFVPFEEVNSESILAQFDIKTNEISYSKPQRLIAEQYNGTMYDIESNYSRQVVTENHKVVVGSEKVLAKNIKLSDIKNIPNFGFKRNKDFEISDGLLRLIVNIVCDATIVRDKVYPDTKCRVQFKLSKQRKIDNVINLLNSIGVKHTLQKATKSITNVLQPFMIRIYGKQAIELIELLNYKKEFPKWFNQLSERQAEIVCNEIGITDGTNINNAVVWSTISKNDIDTIQEMCLSNGISFSFQGVDASASGFANGKPQYRARIRQEKHFPIDKKINSFEYNGFVYCATMPKGTVITRYNGKVGFSGNCDWLEKYLMNKAPELLDMYEFKLGTLLNFGELGIQEISSYAMMKFGKLNIVHGHELKSTLRSVNPARTLYLKTKRSTLVAHHHVTSEHTESDIDGDITTCWSMGCLSQLKPKYAGLDSKYNLGFAYVTKNQKGHFTVENKRIIKGELM